LQDFLVSATGREFKTLPVLVTRQQLLLILAITAFYLVGQLLTGTEVTVASLFALAILFGLLSIFAGGGLRSAFGCLNAILIGKFLLLGIAIKTILLEPADGPLIAPRTTALVMAIGFAGLLIGTLIQSRVACPEHLSMNRPITDRLLLSFSIVIFIASYLGYLAAMIPSTQGEGLQTGGWLGVARALGELKSFSIVPAMMYLWRRKTHRWMTHPMIVAMLTWGGIIGIFSTNKQDAMEPLVFYFLLGFLRYGFGDMRLWGVVSIGTVYYMLIIFPYSQYVRHAGGREGTFEHRIEVTTDTFWRVTSDEQFRSTVTDRVSKPNYFEQRSLSPLGRLAMVSEADKLISATALRGDFSGWETITWGFKLVTPSFLSPDKPVFEAGNYLGHIVGEVGQTDRTTQVSYGVMANLYNAFSISGVLFGTPLFFAGLYYWIRIFLGEARWDGMPTTSTLWFLWLVASFQHSIVESTVSGLIASLAFPVVLGLVWLITTWVSLFLPRDAVVA
jgi:hypothetical protein